MTELTNYCKKFTDDTKKGKYSQASIWRAFKGTEKLEVSSMPPYYQQTYLGQINEADIGKLLDNFSDPSLIEYLSSNHEMREDVKLELRWCHVRRPKSTIVAIRATIVFTEIGEKKYGKNGEKFPDIRKNVVANAVHETDAKEKPKASISTPKDCTKKRVVTQKPCTDKTKRQKHPSMSVAKETSTSETDDTGDDDTKPPEVEDFDMDMDPSKGVEQNSDDDDGREAHRFSEVDDAFIDNDDDR